MTTTISIIFPNQLFEENPCIDKHRRIFIVEDDLFFSYQPFHKMKLILHRASMMFYADYLKNLGYKVTYIEHAAYKNIEHFMHKTFSGEETREVHICEPVDYLLQKRLAKSIDKTGLKLVTYDTPQFMNTKENNDLFLGKEKSNYRMADYYKKQRIEHQILVDGDQPFGGKWSFDQENRKALPKNYIAPTPSFPVKNNYVTKATEYVEKHFSNNPGNVSPFIYPITFDDAKNFLDNFLHYRFNDFGPYQDAFNKDQPFLNHSLISSSLNNGLLTPAFVVEKALAYAASHNIPMSSLEGFIRQVIGWREFVRAIYERHGVKERTTNFWNFQRKFNMKMFEQITPLMDVHQKSIQFAYSHHIERLMLLGNFFVLAEVHPDEVYNYFMTHYIDAYDWVMVPNVYGMSQFADGGLMSTKPYISSSNYLKKMGIKLDSNWAKIWDALYWRFIFINIDFFKSNHRTLPMTYHLNRMSKEKLNEHLTIANDFLKNQKIA